MLSRTGAALSKYAMLPLVLISMSGCSYFLNGKQADPRKPIEVKTTQGTDRCLTSTFEVLAQYFNRKTGPGPAEGVVDCATDSIALFQKHVHGRNPKADAYTATDLIEFINKYFPEIRGRSAEMVPLLMRLKSSIWGGNVDSVTSAELTRVRTFISTFKTAARRLEPFADIYALKLTSRPQTKSELDRFERAMETLVITAQELANGLPDRGQVGFALNDLEKLFVLFDGTKSYAPYVRLALAVKQIVVRPSSVEIGASDWKPVLGAASRFYTFYLRYQTFLKESAILWGQDLYHLESIVHQSLDLLDKSLLLRGGTPIASEEFTRLIDELNSLKYMPSNIRIGSIKKLAWPLLARLLRDPANSPLERNEIASLGKNELSRLRMLLEDFLAGHRMSVAAVGRARVASTKTILQTFAERDLEALAHSGTESARGARVELYNALRCGRLLSWDPDSRLRIIRRSEQPEISLRDLILLNVTRVVTKSVIRGYSRTHLDSSQMMCAEMSKAGTEIFGLTADETHEFYMDLRDLGVDMDLMDSRTTGSGRRSFTEANLFTSVADGNEYLSGREGIEFFQNLISAGGIASTLYKKLEPLCKVHREDITGRSMLKARCLRDYLRSNFAAIFPNLPGISRYVTSIQRDDERWSEFMTALETASRAGGQSDDPVEFGDLRVLSTVLHYTESLFVHHDTNRDEILNSSEVWRAFPSFREFIRRIGNGAAEKESVQRAIFSFLITFGRPPKPGAAGTREVSLWWVGHRVWRESADRAGVMRIISSLAVQSRQAHFLEIKRYLEANPGKMHDVLRNAPSGHVVKLSQLAQCMPEGRLEFRKLMRANARNWSEVALSHQVFARRMDSAIKGNSVLARLCTPLF